jgi:hypothetical protein
VSFVRRKYAAEGGGAPRAPGARRRLSRGCCPRRPTNGRPPPAAGPTAAASSHSSPAPCAPAFFIDYDTKDGRHPTGIPGYRAAVRDGCSDGVVLDCSGGLPPPEQAVRQEMRTTGRYRLTGSLPYRTSTGAGHFEIWVRQKSAA